jgi:hypothetical protein
MRSSPVQVLVVEVAIGGGAYQALRALWSKYRHPRLLFPNPVGSAERIRDAATPMNIGGTQGGFERFRKDTTSVAHCLSCFLNLPWSVVSPM